MGVELHGNAAAAKALQVERPEAGSGREVVVSNTDLEAPVRFVDVRGLRVVADGVELEPVLPPGGGDVLEFGQSLLFLAEPHRFSPPALPSVHAYLQAYASHGPRLDRDVPPAVLKYADAWGPLPDPVVASAGGSERLVARRVPAGIATLVAALYGMGDGLRFPRGERWVAYQLRRGDGAQRGRVLSDQAGLWRAGLKPKGPVCHQGYVKTSTARGSFHTFNGSIPLPAGITWEGSGLQVCDHLHATIDSCALMAALTGSWSAAWSAFRTVEGVIGLYREYPSDAGLRGLARLLHSLAVGYVPCAALGLPVEHWLTEYLPWLLQVLQHRNVWLDRGIWPGLDFGNGVDGGHLEPHHLEHIGPLIEARGWTLKDAARSACTWMVAQLATALDDLLVLVPGPALDPVRQRIREQMRLAGTFILDQGRTLAYDVVAREVRFPTLLWDDVAPGQREGLPDLGAPLAMGGDTTTSRQWSRGVGTRFCATGLRACVRGLPGEPRVDQAHDLAEQIDEAAGGHFWGQTPLRAQLETWVGTGAWRPDE